MQKPASISKPAFVMFDRKVLTAGWLAVVGEAYLQLLAGEEDAALDRTQRQPHLIGNLVVFITLNVH